jgi:NAD-dependent SIR2 family protein deacetylase
LLVWLNGLFTRPDSTLDMLLTVTIKHKGLPDIIETLSHAQRRQQKASLLIGAGCSISAGIPLASGFVKEIEKRYPQAYKMARQVCKNPEDGPTYPEAMNRLTSQERAELVRQFIKGAKINWAHVGIAQLIAKGYVDRVLTVNFDPLVVRACALLNSFPAVYDFALPRKFQSANLPQQSVFYLHGQDTSFQLIHTDNDSRRNLKNVKPVIQEALNGRPLIVLGYSGESDPVFTAIEEQSSFGYGLYWVEHSDSLKPKQHLTKLLSKEDVFFVPDQDADVFFTKACQELGIFPPEAIANPLKHLRIALDSFVDDYKFAGQNQSWDPLATTKEKLDELIREDEEKSRSQLTMQLLAGELDKAQQTVEAISGDLPESLKETASWVYILQGNAFLEQAKQKQGEEADLLFNQATEKYKQALKIKSDRYDALNCLSTTLLYQARLKKGGDRDKILEAAKEKALNAEKIMRGAGAYNLACIFALQNQEDECQQWLNTAWQANNLPDCNHLANDSDLDSVRGRSWFQDFLRKVGCLE